MSHRHTSETPEPVPSLTRHGAQFGGLRVLFLVIKITAVCQVRMSLHLPRSEREDKTSVICCKACEDRERIGFAFAFACLVGKNPKSLSWAPWMTTPYMGGIAGLGSLVYICDIL